jgi:nitrogen fixation/metabolism regulation signal transduction histidine kinase
VVPLDLNALLQGVTSILERTLNPKIVIHHDLSEEPPGTMGDPSQLEQVVMNLVLNARDAVRGAGRVVVRTGDLAPAGAAEVNRSVVLEVKDDGPGIPAEIRDRVFEPYVTTRPQGPQGGSGLGLATVRGIVEGHGGSIEIDGGLDGRGTTMRVVLPAAPPQPAVRPRALVAELPKGSGTILVVDDDHMVRKVVASSLGVLGYKTIDACSGADAVAIFRARHAEIRAVVLDMVMPGMTGKATYLALREIDPEVIVLLMSGHTMNEDVQEILDLGVQSFVSKPYSIAVLAKAMAALLPSPA